ncbi:MotA/TolQ/ExbB proton channel family protein [Desulfobacter curvatus]|uniref:MotA/TolQ/ExbB proton channel family protein n=1 Tax=Desulfobacter curvatus TaxID=2290 RepID=UPI000365D1E3|nr:MotA/TolQ/ExbB proton channel family protein [Desulfobacter curvatus]
MNVIAQGGMMMWPLILLSIPALAILLERWIFFISHPFPVKDANALTPPDTPGVFAPFFDALFSEGSVSTKEKKTTMAAKALLFSFNRSLDFLSTIATVAPLLGLLGTVVGMVQAFSKLAGSQAGMDIGLLADGIWHALLTTAAGLVIAIPVLLAHQWFCAKVRQIAFEMECYANRILES